MAKETQPREGELNPEGHPDGHDYVFDAAAGVWYWLDYAGNRREAECPEGYTYDAQGATQPEPDPPVRGRKRKAEAAAEPAEPAEEEE